MCLIIAKSPNQPLKENLLFNIMESAEKNNPDGIGYMYKRYNGDLAKVFINKKIGINSIEDTINEIRCLKIEEKDELAVHLRYGTSGEKNVNNVHPFIVDSESKEILRIFGATNHPCIMHNGIFHQFTVNNSIFSDTYYFVKMFLSKYNILYEPKKIEFLKNNIFGNKLAVMYPQKDKEMAFLGTFFCEEGSFRVSNKFYNTEKKKEKIWYA